MKASMVVLILLGLAIVGIGSLSTTGCLVNRRSEGYTCETDADCDDRVCDRGYCVTAACPSVCTSCSVSAKTCRIECGSNKNCGAVQCPAGYDCTIKCSTPNACGEINCTGAAGCDITCSGQSACGAITCGVQACKIDCSNNASCGAVNCVDSCACDIQCANASCPTTSCPVRGGLSCTEDGTTTTPCDSGSQACDTCL